MLNELLEDGEGTEEERMLLLLLLAMSPPPLKVLAPLISLLESLVEGLLEATAGTRYIFRGLLNFGNIIWLLLVGVGLDDFDNPCESILFLIKNL